MSITLKNIQEKKADIINISQRYHAENIRIFGSVARGEATDKSDVDFLVSFLPNASLFDQAGLIEELSQLLERNVDVVSERAVSPYLRETIKAEALSL
jgi:predicted nucleotidyltransferase